MTEDRTEEHDWRPIIALAERYGYKQPATFKAWCEETQVPIMSLSKQVMLVDHNQVKQRLRLMWRAKNKEPLTVDETEHLIFAFQNKPERWEEYALDYHHQAMNEAEIHRLLKEYS
jgi:hypothetical protein